MLRDRRQLLLLFLGLLLSVPAPILMWRLYRATPCLEALPWDSANHALDGLRLYHSVVSLSFPSFFSHLMSMSHWPPVPAVLEALFFAGFGATAASAVGLSLLSLFMVFLVPYCFLVLHLFKGDWVRGIVAFLAYATFVVSAEAILRYSVFVMYELPGAMLTIAAVIAYWLALEARATGDEPRAIRGYRRAGILVLLLLLSKWNYGLQFLISMGLVELLLTPFEYWRKLAARTLAPFLSPREATFLWLTGALVSLWIGIILITGGFNGTVLGVRVSATEIANPLYALYVIVLARVFRLFWRNKLDLGDFLPYHRQLLGWMALPYAMWLLYPTPNRFKTLLYHLSHGAPHPIPRLSWHRLEHYAGFIVGDFVTGAPQAWLLLFGWVGACALAWRLAGRGNWGSASLAIFGTFAWFSSGYLTNNLEPRFLVNFMPVLYLGAAWFLVSAIPIARWGSIPAIVALVVPLSHHAEIRATFSDSARLPISDSVTRTPFCLADYSLVETLRNEVVSRVGGSRGVTTIGLEDMHQLCPLIQWELHRRNPHFAKLPEPKVCDHGYRVSPEEHVRSGLEKDNLEWVLVTDREPSSRAAAHSAAVKSLLEALPPERLERHGVSFRALGLQATLYHVRSSGIKDWAVRDSNP